MLFSSARHLTISSHVQMAAPAQLQRWGRYQWHNVSPSGLHPSVQGSQNMPQQGICPSRCRSWARLACLTLCWTLFSRCPRFCSLLTPTSLEDTWTHFFCFLLTGDRLNSPKISQPYPSFFSFRLILAIMPISVPRGSLPMLFPYFELPQYAAVHVIIYLLISCEIICIHSTLHLGYLRTD